MYLPIFAAGTGDLTRSYGQAAGPGEQEQQHQQGQREALQHPVHTVDSAAVLEDLTQVSLLPVPVANQIVVAMYVSSPPFSIVWNELYRFRVCIKLKYRRELFRIFFAHFRTAFVLIFGSNLVVLLRKFEFV